MTESTKEPLSFTKNWIPVNEMYYRLLEVSDMHWSQRANINAQIIAFPNGGAITIFQPQISQRTHIHIYSAYGTLLADITYDNGHLVSVGWSSTETLIAVNSEGLITEYSITGSKIDDFRVHDVTLQTSKVFVHDSEVFLMAITSSFSVLFRRGLNNPFEDVIDISKLTTSLTCWTPFFDAVKNSAAAIVCGKNQKIVSVKGSGAESVLLFASFDFNHIISIAVSNDNKSVALLTDTNYIWCGSIDLSNLLYEVDCNAFGSVTSVVWCGLKAITYAADGQYVLQGGETDNYVYDSDGQVFLVQETDGTRIIDRKKHLMLQEVPASLVQTYMVWNNPSSILLDAYTEYKDKSYQTIEMIDALGTEIEAAVCGLIEAAGKEWDVRLQRTLLKAAMYGRSFSQVVDKDFFYKTCQSLRILNNLRMPYVGLPLSYLQMQEVGLTSIVSRLTTRRLFTLAYEICHLNKNTEGVSFVLTAWARHIIMHSKLVENQIAQEILKILSFNPSVPIDSIVSAAVELGKADLATQLVEYNSSPEAIISTLLKVGNINRAEKVAVDSCDPSLIYSVIIYMKNKLTENDFMLRLSSNKVINALGIKYLEEFYPNWLESLYRQEDKIKSLASYKLLKCQNASLSQKKQILREVCELAQQKSIIKNTCTFSLNLLHFQLDVKEKLPSQVNPVGLSILQTISKLCELGFVQESLTLKKDFIVPDNRFYWTAVSSLAKSRYWAKIDSLIEAKRNALPATAYCDIYIEVGAPVQELEKHVGKLSNDLRCAYYLKANLLNKAAEVAIKSKNPEYINNVLGCCKTGVHDSLIEALQREL